MTNSSAMGNEARIWGPPGCGKTTYLSKQISHAAAKYGSEGVMVASFTRAAPADLVGRDLPLVRGSVGTLHSHCYRALGCPDIADAHVGEWNRAHPGLRLSPAFSGVDEMPTEYSISTVGDELYGGLQILRARRVASEVWPARVRRFAEVWTAWKLENRMLDFTDLLETALRDLKVPPCGPKVIVVDEAQDLSALQLALLRQ